MFQQSLSSDNLNVNLIRFNQLLFEAHNFFQIRDMPNAIKSYETALKEPEAQKDQEKQAIIKTNLGIILFHNCEYKRSQSLLVDALGYLDRKTEFRQALIIKILANLAIVKLIMTEFQECKDYNDQAIQLIMGSPSPFKQTLFKELMYIYFRFQSFEAMGDGNFENLEQKYDGPSLACFYSSMGLNRELCNDFPLAHKYHTKALEIWKSVNENGFIVITLRRLILIAQVLKIDQKEYATQLQRYMQSEELRGISPEVLFKDCERKLTCARDITTSLKRVEDQIKQQYNKDLLSKPAENQQQNDFWKQAVRLRLKKAMATSIQLLSQQPQNQEPLHQSIAQLQHTLQLLDQQQPYENHIANLAFTRETVKNAQNTLNKFVIRCKKIQLEPLFDYLYNTQQQKQQYIQSQIPILTQQPPFELASKVNKEFYSQYQNESAHSHRSQQQYKSVQGQQLPDQQQYQVQQPPSQIQQSYVNGQSASQVPYNYNPSQLSQNQYQSSYITGQNPVMTQSQRANQMQQQMHESNRVAIKQNMIPSARSGIQQAPNSQNPSQIRQLQQPPQQRTNSKYPILRERPIHPPNPNLKIGLDALYKNAMNVAILGDYLMKCNKTSNGRIQRFFQLGIDNTLRWSSKESQIADQNKVSFYAVSDIRGLLYGKRTDVLMKSSNKDLEPWLCFSLMMKTRSMDFYVTEVQVRTWVLALSSEILKRNPRATVQRLGQYLWRRLRMRLEWFLIDKNKKVKRSSIKKRITLGYLLVLYAKNGQRLQ